MVTLRRFTAPAKARQPDQQLIRASRKLARWLIDNHRLKERLCSSKLRQLRRRLTSLRLLARCTRFTEPSYDGITLLHDDNAHAGLLALDPGQKTPIHDHADSTSLSLLLTGDAIIDGYRLCKFSTNGSARLTKYKTTRLHDSAKNTVCITPKGDFHRLSSKNLFSIILNVQFPPVLMDKRLIAIVTGTTGPEQYQCILITEKAIQQITSNRQYMTPP